ncbi:MAG: stage II sporulation protein M [Bacteroidales bacterium]
MQEATFIRNNNPRWKEAERFLKAKRNISPERLATIFTQLNDDLAYARTYYPNSRTVKYLNQLTIQFHQKINISKKYNLRRIYDFFRYHYPLLIYKNRIFLFYSFLIFALSASIGALSAANDQHFVRLIMGDNYVEMTLENIKKGQPTGIYKSMEPLPMFAYITLNNIRVAFITFGAGILAALGTGFLLLQNGIMLGSFQYFFAQHNVLQESAMAIWMHGALEIFSIIVAGAAGLVLGNSLLFPGTYPRLVSLKKGAQQGVRIVFGLLPFFIIAGFIESYLTRHAQINWLSLMIIGASVLIILGYFFIYPFILTGKYHTQT